jgi:phenylacetate-CoA ligase
MVYPHYRQTIETAFGTKLYDTYGCAEGMHISAQCGNDDNYHVHSLDVVVEYLDSAGSPVPPGQAGDVIVTRLHPGPMPLIRYRIGDRATKGPDERCACGRGFELMRSIQGRDTDFVITPSGNRLIVHFFTGVIEHFTEVDSFQVVQNALDSMQVRIVPRNGFSSDTEKRLVAALASKGAEGMRIDVEIVREIPLSDGGKRRFVIRDIDYES